MKILGDMEPSDYINASFVGDVFTGTPRRYIAAQGPGSDTIPAFWSMIWQYKVEVVVMLTRWIFLFSFLLNTILIYEWLT